MMRLHQTATKQYLAQTREIFYCQCKIKIPLEMGEQLLDECFERMEYIDKTYNSYQPGSYFDQINQNAGSWVETDEWTIKMLNIIKTVSVVTDGAYDITAMPLLKLWGFYKQRPERIPIQEEIQETLKRVDHSLISIEGNNVRIAAGQEIVTGSFIKAFAVDQVVRFLREKGVQDAIINAGGSTIFALNKEDDPHWHVQVPSHPSNGRYDRIGLNNNCFNLSGKSHNYITVNGTQYGHVLNTRTGLPSDAEQVGVITDSAFLGDVLSTALFAVEEEKTASVIRQLQHYFSFDYYRLEQNETRTQNKCF